jgi:hypothetical protein
MTEEYKNMSTLLGWNGFSLLACRRFNYVGAAHVNAALIILQIYDLQRATNLLKAAEIPDEVIARVLQSHAIVRPYKSADICQKEW